MSASTAEVHETARRLRGAGEAWCARPLAERAERVAAVLDAWCAPRSPWRERLIAEHAEPAGLHPATLKAGLEGALEVWSGAALRALVAEETALVAARVPSVRLHGFPLTGCVLAGVIPMPSIQSLLLPLVLGSPVLACSASRDPVTPRLVIDSLRELDPQLGACAAALAIPRRDEAAVQALCDTVACLVATGGDEAVTALAARVHPPRRFVGHGHRLSLALLGPETRLEEAAEALARDVAWWDQQGCLSPVSVHLVGADAEALAAALFEALLRAEARWPRGVCEPAEAARMASERADAELRAAAGTGARLWCAPGDSCAVVLEPDPRPRPAPLQRFVRVHAAPDAQAALAALRPLAPHLAGVALAGFGAAEPALADALLALGASRVCQPGALQRPPFGWHHDGAPLLLPLARLGDSELN